jgi:hypothetical protein
MRSVVGSARVANDRQSRGGGEDEFLMPSQNPNCVIWAGAVWLDWCAWFGLAQSFGPGGLRDCARHMYQLGCSPIQYQYTIYNIYTMSLFSAYTEPPL